MSTADDSKDCPSPCEEMAGSFVAEANDSADESDDSEESEPKLKYVRMKNSLVNIFNKYEAKCIAVHPKFVCLGNNWGMIHMLDHQGNTVLQELRLHSTDVNQISIDRNGDFIASCSDDGRVYIQGLYSSDNNQALKKENCKVKSVAIDPNYYKPGSGRRFITGLSNAKNVFMSCLPTF